jgi:predicted transcriptional regulator
MNINSKEAQKFLNAKNIDELLTITFKSNLSAGVKSYLNRMWLKKNKISSQNLEKARKAHPLYIQKKRLSDKNGRLKRIENDGEFISKSNEPWTDKEIKFLKDNPDMSYDDLVKSLGRSRDAIHSKKRDLKYYKIDKRDKKIYKTFHNIKISKQWTDKEVELLKKNENMSIKELSELLNRTPGSINQKKNDLKEIRTKGEIKNSGVPWTAKDIKYLQKNLSKSSRELAEALSRSKSSVETKLHKLRKKGDISYRI